MDAIILLPLISGIGLLFWGDSVKEEHPLLTLLLQLLFIPLIFLSVHLGIIEATLSYGADTQLVETLASITEYLSYIMFGIMAYFMFIILGRVKDMIMQKRAENHNKKYGDD